MARHSQGLAMLVLAVAAGLAMPSYAQAPGTVSVVFAKAGLIVGAGGGRGVLTYRGRDHPFRVAGLSLGITIGASAMRLTGRVSGLRELKDFSGIYDAVGAGGALIGGFGGVQLTNKKGVIITLQGLEAGWNLRLTGAGSESRCSRPECAGKIWIVLFISQLRSARDREPRLGPRAQCRARTWSRPRGFLRPRAVPH